MDSVGVELDVELVDDSGTGHINVGDGLALHDDPVGLTLAHKPADLATERPGVGEEEGCFPAIDEHAGHFPRGWIHLDRMPAVEAVDVTGATASVAATGVSMNPPVVAAATADTSMTGVSAAGFTNFTAARKIVVATATNGEGSYTVSPQLLKLVVPVSATADSHEVRDVAEVVIRESRERTVTLLFDREHNLEERILNEQFIS